MRGAAVIKLRWVAGLQRLYLPRAVALMKTTVAASPLSRGPFYS